MASAAPDTFGGGTNPPNSRSIKPAKARVTCTLGGLASGASATVTIVVKPTSKGTITNTATGSANQADPNTVNNKATATTTVTS